MDAVLIADLARNSLLLNQLLSHFIWFLAHLAYGACCHSAVFPVPSTLVQEDVRNAKYENICDQILFSRSKEIFQGRLINIFRHIDISECTFECLAFWKRGIQSGGVTTK